MANVIVGKSIRRLSLPLWDPRPESGGVRDYDTSGMVAELPAGRLPVGDLTSLIESSNIRRVHVLAWRDLDDPEAGGSEIHAHEVVRRWAAAGLDVTVRTSRAAGLPETDERDDYQVIRRGGRFQVFPDAVIAELFRQHGRRDAVVEIWNGVPYLTPLWVRGPRMALLHHHHEALWPLALPAPAAWLGSFFERRIAPPFYRSTPVVTLSDSSRAELLRALRLRPRHVHVVEPGVSDNFTPGGSRAPEPLVVVAGRLATYKRIDSLIHALSVVREQLPQVRLEVIGSGEAEADLRRIVARLGAGSWVRFLGRVSEDRLIEAYRRAWVVASTSTSEGWGMTLTEAARCATPTVATRIPGHLDAIADGVSGFLVEKGPELVNRLSEILSEPARRDELAAGAREWSSRFDWDQTATELFRILASTVRGR